MDTAQFTLMILETIRKVISEIFVLPLWRILDFFLPKKSNHWAFATHHIKGDCFIENPRAVFEEIKGDAKITKVIFTREKPADFSIEGAVNVEIYRIKSLKGLMKLSQCKVLLVSHSISMDISFRWKDKGFSIVKPSLRKRCVVNLWHGIPLKSLLALANSEVRQKTDRVKFRRTERRYYAGLVSSSAVDSHAMATMFYPIKYDNVWVTGLPRNDFLLRSERNLPKHFEISLRKIKRIKGDKKLVVYAPTYRQAHVVSGSTYYQFQENEMDQLKKILEKHNAILGFRTHYFENSKAMFNLDEYVDKQMIFNLGHNEIQEIAPVIREADIVITDYSSVYIDAMYLNKPVLSFAYDLEHYKKNEDGLLYDLDYAFPSRINKDFGGMLEELEKEFSQNKQTQSHHYRATQKLFFKYFDDRNSERVVQKIRDAI